MKANEVPKKFYYAPYGDIREDYPITDNDIEYVRKDSFIERACEWIKESITNNPECNRIISKKGVITMGLLIENFRKYMEGE